MFVGRAVGAAQACRRRRCGRVFSRSPSSGSRSAVAVALRVHDVRPPSDRRVACGATARWWSSPPNRPRTVGGGRLMFRGDPEGRRRPSAGRPGRGVRIGHGLRRADRGPPGHLPRPRRQRPMRRDLTVAVLSATGEPTVGGAGLVQRIAARVRAAFADAARTALPADQAAMLPALVLGDTSALTAPTVDEFRVAGLTHLTAVSGANVTIVCGAVLLAAGAGRPARGRRPGRAGAARVRRRGAAVGERAARRGDGRHHAVGGACRTAGGRRFRRCRPRRDRADDRRTPSSPSTSGSRCRCRPPRRSS